MRSLRTGILQQERNLKVSTPITTDDMIFWYNGENIISSNNKVSRVNDLSGNEYHLSQLIENHKPITNVLPNGKIGFGYNTFNKFTLPKIYTGEKTFFWVASKDSSTNQQFIFDSLLAGYNRFLIFSIGSTIYCSGRKINVNIPYNHKLFTLKINSNLDTEIYINGVLVTGNDYSFKSNDIGEISLLGFGGNYIHQGYLYTAISYDKYIPIDKQEEIENHLMSEYNII